MAEEALIQKGEPDDDQPSRDEERKQARADCGVAGPYLEPGRLDGDENAECQNAAAKHPFTDS